MNRKPLLLFALMALFAPLAVMGQGFDHLTYFTQTSTDDFKHGTPYLVDIADGSVSLQYRMSSVAEWASTTNMPQTLKQHQVVSWRDYVILVGGSSNGTNAVNTVYRATKQDNGISGWSGGLPVLCDCQQSGGARSFVSCIQGRFKPYTEDTVNGRLHFLVCTIRPRARETID